MITVKDPNTLAAILQWQFHSKLVALMKWLSENKLHVVITEGGRKKKHPNDLHGTAPARAIDVRSWVYTDAQKTADWINESWRYDPDRPDMKCCVYHAVCQECGTRHNPPYRTKCDNCRLDISGHWHFHLQVHPKTEFKNDN